MKRRLLILIISVLLPHAVWAEGFPSLTSTWRAQRDTASVQLVRMWLSGVPGPLWQKETLRFVDREIKLSIIEPEASLLVSEPEVDVQRLPVSLLLVILRQNGIGLDPVVFFADKEFLVLAPVGGVSHAAK